MNRAERKDLVITCLTQNDKNKDLHYKKIKNHLLSENPEIIYSASVNPKYLEIDHTPIIMTDNVFDALTTIDEYNLNKRKEVPFVIYGKRTKGGAIFLDDLYCNFDKLKEDSANIEKLEDFLFARLDVFLQDNMKEQVIVLGHTHPFTSKISFNYSIADLCFHLFYYNYKVFHDQSHGNLLLSLVKTITQDYNFIIYDANNNIFKTFDKVYLQTKKKEFIPLNALNYCDD
jgi:hypothetical protein